MHFIYSPVKREHRQISLQMKMDNFNISFLFSDFNMLLLIRQRIIAADANNKHFYTISFQFSTSVNKSEKRSDREQRKYCYYQNDGSQNEKMPQKMQSQKT